MLGLQGTDLPAGLESRGRRDAGPWAECREEGRLVGRVGYGKVESECPGRSCRWGVGVGSGSWSKSSQVKGTWACDGIGGGGGDEGLYSDVGDKEKLA